MNLVVSELCVDCFILEKIPISVGGRDNEVLLFSFFPFPSQSSLIFSFLHFDYKLVSFCRGTMENTKEQSLF